jgi:hypothetical protein
VKAGAKAVAALMLAGVCAGGLARADDLQAQVAQVQSSPKPAETKPQDLNLKEQGAKPQDANPQGSNPADGKGSTSADQPSQNASVGVCEVPEYLLATDSPLSKVAEAVKTKRRLDILVVGSGSSSLAGPEGAKTAYPARLEAALRERLSGIEVNVAADLQVKKTAADVAEGLEDLVKDRKPTLVIWQTGTVDALKSVDPDDFRAAVDDGIAALQGAGSDVLLMNLQYSPRTETMITVAPYLDNMRVSAEEHNIPLFDRFAIMRHWNESGYFDLFNPSRDFGLAKRVHDCLGQALATFVIGAAHIDTAELRIQH